MHIRGKFSFCLSILTASLVLMAGPRVSTAAEAVAEFYKGKTISLIVPYAPGGYYDLGARLMGRHLTKFIPGKPNLIVQNQPSAGGIGLANRFATGAENDGTQLGVLQRAVPQYAFMDDPSARFDPLKLTWIGSLSAYETDSYVMVVNTSHAIYSADSLRGNKTLLRLGAGRAGSTNLTLGLIAKEVLGMNIEMIRGYRGNAEILLALERGEVDGLLSDLSLISASGNELWNAKKAAAVVQFARKTRLPELPDVPTARELVKDPADLALLNFAEMPFFMALPVAGPATMPADRVKALQAAFMQMGNDAEFLADAKKMHFSVDPISGDAVLELIKEAAATSPEIIERFKNIIAK